MTALKNDKVDAKPAMQFVTSGIWITIRNVLKEPIPDFQLRLLDLINDAKDGFDTRSEILILIATQYGRSATLRSVGLAMRAGEIKYGDWNFLNGHGKFQLLGAIERHALLMLDGEFWDVDTSDRLGVNVSHYGCVVAGINMMWYQEEYGTSIDDGPQRGKEISNAIPFKSTTTDTGVTGTCSR